MAVMLNDWSCLLGFVKRTPKLVDDEDYKGKCCIFTLSTRDHRTIKEVTCMATGMLCEQLMVYGAVGSFWAVGGILSLHQKKNSKKMELVLKCVEIELLKRPTIPNITVDEFIEGYAPKSIVKRAKERKNGNS